MNQPPAGPLVVLATLFVVAPLVRGMPETSRQPDSPPESIVLPGEWMVPRPVADVRAAIRSVMVSRGIRVAGEDQVNGVVITEPMSYPAAWPGAEALGLSILHTPRRAKIHLHVAPDLEPARLAVGAILETDYAAVPLRESKWKGGSTFYGQRALGQMFAEWIAQSLGVRLVPLPADAAERAALARRLLPEASTGCGGRTAPLLAMGMVPARPMSKPRFPVIPEYPRQELEHRRGGTVTMQGEVTEQGTYTRLSWLRGIEDPNLVAAALGASGMSIYSPPLVDGCPVRTQLAFETSFMIR